MAKSFQFAHLLKHTRHHLHQAELAFQQLMQTHETKDSLRLTSCIGALDCLYYQALGCEEVLLAKSIHRRLNRIDLGLSEVTGQSY